MLHLLERTTVLTSSTAHGWVSSQKVQPRHEEKIVDKQFHIKDNVKLSHLKLCTSGTKHASCVHAQPFRRFLNAQLVKLVLVQVGLLIPLVHLLILVHENVIYLDQLTSWNDCRRRYYSKR